MVILKRHLLIIKDCVCHFDGKTALWDRASLQSRIIDWKTGFVICIQYVKDFRSLLPLIMTNGIVIQPVLRSGVEVPVYKFVKALVRKFGEDWYAELETVAEEYKNNQNRKKFLFSILKSYILHYLRFFVNYKILFTFYNL
jgi:hypothetical protein